MADDPDAGSWSSAALAASTADGCVVVGSEHTETNLRWAANNLTTNGQMASRSVTVISILDGAAGTSAGVVSRSVTSADEVVDLVAASEQAAAKSGPADDAAPLVEPYDTADDWSADPARTSVAVFARFADELGAAFAAAGRTDRLLFGFAEHTATSTFVASSTGLRRRFDQPSGRLELNAKSADYRRSAWDGVHTRDFADVDIGALTDGLHTRLDWAATTHDLAPGRYETILPPSAVADLMLDAYWTASARDAEEGRNVYARSGGRTRIGERLCDASADVAFGSGGAGPAAARRSRSPPRRPPACSRCSTTALPVDACSWISDGKLAELVRTRSWAARTGARARLLVDNLDAHRRRHGEPGRHDREHRAWAAVDVPVVHPRGRSADLAAHRADPGRRLPRGERRGPGRGEQLPLQRVAGGRCWVASPRSGARSRRCPGSGPTGSAGPPCPRCGSPTSTCRRSSQAS